MEQMIAPNAPVAGIARLGDLKDSLFRDKAGAIFFKGIFAVWAISTKGETLPYSVNGERNQNEMVDIIDPTDVGMKPWKR